jgi:cytidylate kinase
MLSKGEEATMEDVLRNLRERDYIDANREIHPLTKADDAILLDNSDMTLEDQLVWIKEILKQREK